MNKKNKQRKINSQRRKAIKIIHERKIAKEQFQLEKDVQKLQNQNTQIVRTTSIKELERIKKSQESKPNNTYSIEEIKKRRRKLKNEQRRSK